MSCSPNKLIKENTKMTRNISEVLLVNSHPKTRLHNQFAIYKYIISTTIEIRNNITNGTNARVVLLTILAKNNLHNQFCNLQIHLKIHLPLQSQTNTK